METTTKEIFMNNFTDFELIAIENAYEELLIILKEQGDDKEFSVAIEEASFIHDLDENMENAVKEMFDNQDSPFYGFDFE